jgi:hypothetical protein
MPARSSFHAKPRTTPKESLLGRLLDPIDRLSETIYSILILLTFTLAFQIFKFETAPSKPLSVDEIEALFIGALGAILAWGVIDGVMHALMAMFERGERHRLLQHIQAAETDRDGVAVIAEEFDFILEPITAEEERHKLYKSVFEHLREGQPRKIGFKREDFAGAVGCVLVALIAVLPSLAPLVLLRQDPMLALRVSNVISFIVLFAAGYSWGTHTGANPWKTGLLLFFIGAIMVLVAILLGG